MSEIQTQSLQFRTAEAQATGASGALGVITRGLHQRKEEGQGKTRVEEDGTVMEYDTEKKAWFPKVSIGYRTYISIIK